MSPEHAASFTGLVKLYHMVKNNFPVVMRKKNENREKAIFLISYSNHLEEPLNETRCMLLTLILYGKLICLLYKI